MMIFSVLVEGLSKAVQITDRGNRGETIHSASEADSMMISLAVALEAWVVLAVDSLAHLFQVAAWVVARVLVLKLPQ